MNIKFTININLSIENHLMVRDMQTAERMRPNLSLFSSIRLLFSFTFSLQWNANKNAQTLAD